MVDPISVSAIIISVISTLSVGILAIVKLIKHSSCCFGLYDFEGKDTN
jgi:hypothetical protein